MIEQDLLRRFLFEDLGVRGEWVKLTTSWQAAKKYQQGPQNAQIQLGQALAAVVMLSATVKFIGSMILQAQGDGDLKAVVAQSTHDRKIRGLLRSNDHVTPGSLETLFGQGRLVLTIEPDHAQPYQGIVPLQGRNLATALQIYFEQSEQLNTRLWLFANETHAAGLLVTGTTLAKQLPRLIGNVLGYWRIQLLSRNYWNWTANICCIDCLMKKKSGCSMPNRLNSSAPVPGQESKEPYARWAKRNWKTYYRSRVPFK